MPNSSRRERSAAVLVGVLLLWAGPSHLWAQVLRERPLVFGDGRVALAGDISAGFSCARGETIHGCGEDLGWFNNTGYDDSLVRLFRVNVSASFKAARRVSVLTEIRSDNLRQPVPYALYVRIRPWLGQRFDIQAGRIPPSFGAFSRRPYPTDNILIGYPLAYQYLTAIRADSLPATADELIRMRGEGWRLAYSIGDTERRAGLPLVDGLRWDTGVQAHFTNDIIDAAVSVTTGTLGHPVVHEDNAGKQVSGRVGIQPVPGLVAGISAARGPFGSRTATVAAGLTPDDVSMTQTTWGTDLEYSRGYYVIRAETVVSTFRLPSVGAGQLDTPLRAVAASVEGRYRIRPGLYAAARADHMTFNEIVGSAGAVTWDAPLWRLEVGGGYSLQRNLLLKVVYQHNERDGGKVPVVSLASAQLVYWF